MSLCIPSSYEQAACSFNCLSSNQETVIAWLSINLSDVMIWLDVRMFFPNFYTICTDVNFNLYIVICIFGNLFWLGKTLAYATVHVLSEIISKNKHYLTSLRTLHRLILFHTFSLFSVFSFPIYSNFFYNQLYDHIFPQKFELKNVTLNIFSIGCCE